MRTMRPKPSTILPVLLTALLALSLDGAAVAAKGARDKDKRGDTGTSSTPTALVATVPGKQLKMLNLALAPRLTRIADEAADQVLSDGTAADDAPDWTDVTAVYLGRGKVTRKLLDRMETDYPRGAAGAIRGADADWAPGDEALLIGVQLAAKRPADSVAQQVEVGLDGNAAGPLQAGAATDTRAGLERFSLSGVFSNGTESSGTTDVSGRLPGEAIDYYNAESGVMGYYDARAHTYALLVPLPQDARAVSVALRSMTPAGEVIDRLTLPGGGPLVPLDDAALGWTDATAEPPLACRSLETSSSGAGLADIDAGLTRVRYAVGTDPSLDEAAAEAQLAALGADSDTIALTFQPVGEGDPVAVEAIVQRLPDLRAATLTMDVPPGTWTFTPDDAAALRTPSGEAIVDASSLVGSGGLRTAEGLDGFVAGDPRCATFDLGADACSFVPADGMAGLVGMAASEIEQSVVTRSDGSLWCVGTASASGQVRYRARFGTDEATSADFAAEVSAVDCAATPLDLAVESARLDCGAQGFERHVFRVLPASTAGEDAVGGLLISVDMLVDGAKPSGERYDADAAAALFGQLVADVTASARPALTTADADLAA